MRRFAVVVAVLLLFSVIPVYGQVVCGNNILDIGEECDVSAPLGDANCPGLCEVNDCVCGKESSFVLFDLAIGHNMLFSKVQDLLHIVKDFLVQLEFKTIEFTLSNYACDDQPVSFWFPADKDPYGKLHEIDAMMRLLIDSMERAIDVNSAAFGSVNSADLLIAEERLGQAEVAISINDFRRALECKCLAYKGLAEIPDASDPPLVDCILIVP